MATKDGKQQGITFIIHFKSSSWQINWDLLKKSKKNHPKTKPTNKNKQKTSYIRQALEWLQAQDLLFWLNLL